MSTTITSSSIGDSLRGFNTRPRNVVSDNGVTYTLLTAQRVEAQVPPKEEKGITHVFCIYREDMDSEGLVASSKLLGLCSRIENIIPFFTKYGVRIKNQCAIEKEGVAQYVSSDFNQRFLQQVFYGSNFKVCLYAILIKIGEPIF